MPSSTKWSVGFCLWVLVLPHLLLSSAFSASDVQQDQIPLGEPRQVVLAWCERRPFPTAVLRGWAGSLLVRLPWVRSSGPTVGGSRGEHPMKCTAVPRAFKCLTQSAFLFMRRIVRGARCKNTKSQNCPRSDMDHCCPHRVSLEDQLFLLAALVSGQSLVA